MSATAAAFVAVFAALVAVVLMSSHGGELQHLRQQQQQKPAPTVVIVGAGLTGLCAAVEAHSRGARVIVLEQEKTCGGNSRLASSGLNGVNTAAQREQHVEDSEQLFLDDTRKSGRGRDQAELAELLVRNSAAAIEFLERQGNLSLSIVSLLGGHSRPRTHRAAITGKPMNVGLAITLAMEARVRALVPPVEIRTDTPVSELLTADQGRRVAGVRTGAGDVSADAVVLATGGYSTDSEGLLAEFTPHLRGVPSTNGNWKSSGGGVRMGRQVGARLALMDAVQVHPTGLVDPAQPRAPFVILAGEALRGNGGIFISKEGKRFVNELGYRDHVSEAIFQAGSNLTVAGGITPPAVFLVLNDAAVSKFREAIQFYSFKKLVFKGSYCSVDLFLRSQPLFKYKDWREFAEAQSVPFDNLEVTLREYEEARAKGVDAFGKMSFESCPISTEQAVTVMIVTPAVHYTMGGVVIDASTRVVRDGDGGPIAGLFAAGEVTGGLHGENRLGGNSLLECVVFGRIAGVAAAARQ